MFFLEQTTLSKQKSPQLKKQDSYDKDHRTRMENPHAFRKNWPKKKARANRRDRVALRSELASGNAEDLTPNAVAKLRNKNPVVKNGVSTLRVSIRTKVKNRLQRLLAKAKGASPNKDLMNDAPRGRELI